MNGRARAGAGAGGRHGSPRDLGGVIGALRRRVRLDTVLAAGAIIVAAVPLLLAVGWLLAGARGWAAPGVGPLALELLALGGAAAWLAWRGRRWLIETSEAWVAAAVERARGLPAGSVRGVLELVRAPQPGTSPALAARGERRIAALVARPGGAAGGADLLDAVGRPARRRRTAALGGLGALVTLAGVLGFAAPERARAGWGPLLRPVSNLSPPPLPALRVQPGDARITRGESLPLAVAAPARTSVTLSWQARGDVVRSRRLALESGRARTVLASIDAPTRYWVSAPDGAVSDTFRIAVREALLVSALTIDADYPDYLDRPDERYEGELAALAVPEGTTLAIRGGATLPLADVALERDGPDGRTRVGLSVTGSDFAGRWTPRESGTYTWRVIGSDGATAAFAPSPLELTVEPDAAPVVEITFPAVDTVLPPDLTQPFAASALDDHGLRSAALVSWKVGAGGTREPPRTEALAIDGEPMRVLLQGAIDASTRGMLPGDTLFYQVRATDASPMARTGVSATYHLRVPSMAEIRHEVWAETERMQERATRAADAAKELQEATRDMDRRGGSSAADGGAGRGGPPGSMEFGAAQEARQVLERQQRLLEQVESLQQDSEALRRALEQAGLTDPELQERLRELSELYQEVLTPELREELAALQRALEELDEAAVRRAIEELARQQGEVRERLEQGLELLRRAAAEQQMNALAQDAGELATQQQAVADALRENSQAQAQAHAQAESESESESESADRLGQQRELEERTEELGERLAELEERLGEQDEAEAAARTDAAATDAAQAQGDMREAGDRLAAGQPRAASPAADSAAARLEAAAETLSTARDSMAEAWRDEAERAVEQAANEALALAEREHALVQRMQGAPSAPQAEAKAEAGGERQGQQQGGQQQAGQQLPAPPQAGGQQRPQEGGAGAQPMPQGQSAQQGGEQSAPAGAPQQGGGQRPGPGPGGQRQGGGEGGQAGQGGGDIRAEQAAVQQGLETLGRNLSEAGRRSAMVNRDVGTALARANLSMQRTLEALEAAQGSGRMPVPEASRTLDALNQLALSLLGNQDQIQRAQSGTGLQQMLEQLSELAQRQGQLNARTGSLAPLDLGPQVLAQNLQQLAQAQREIAGTLQGIESARGGSEDVLGQLDALAREADELAGALQQGALTPDVLRRQERLFHRMLDAGRSLERDEYSDEREAERPGAASPFRAEPLDPGEVGGVRYPLPSAERLQALPAAYRRLILEYFERLNREGAERPEGGRP